MTLACLTQLPRLRALLPALLIAAQILSPTTAMAQTDDPVCTPIDPDKVRIEQALDDKLRISARAAIGNCLQEIYSDERGKPHGVRMIFALPKNWGTPKAVIELLFTHLKQLAPLVFTMQPDATSFELDLRNESSSKILFGIEISAKTSARANWRRDSLAQLDALLQKQAEPGDGLYTPDAELRKTWHILAGRASGESPRQERVTKLAKALLGARILQLDLGPSRTVFLNFALKSGTVASNDALLLEAFKEFRTIAASLFKTLPENEADGMSVAAFPKGSTDGLVEFTISRAAAKSVNWKTLTPAQFFALTRSTASPDPGAFIKFNHVDVGNAWVKLTKAK